LKNDSIECFVQLILPLHCLSNYRQFHRQLLQVIYWYIAKADVLLSATLGYLQRHWPIGSYTKQLLFLTEYEKLMITFEQKATPEMFIAFFRKISDAVNNEASLVAQAALEIVRNQQLYQALKASSPSVFYAMTLELNATAKTHWDSDIREDAVLSLDIMKSIDMAAFGKATESLRMAKARKVSAFGLCKAGWTKVTMLGQAQDPNVVAMGDVEKLRDCV
jgi:hypothetical protein